MSGSGTELEPGKFVSVLTPLMKAIGLGIAARGGAAGPMLVGGGELIDEGYQTRQQRAVLQQMTQLLQPISRSETTAGTPGTPGTPSVFPPQPPTALPESAVPSAAETMIAGRVGTPGSPGTRREWMSMPTQAELMQRIAGTTMPDVTRGQLLQEILRLRMPSDVERPKAVTEELERARTGEERTRQAGVFTAASREGATPEARGAALAEGRDVPPTPSKEQWVQRSDGTMQRIDRRTGEPIAPPVPQRTEEQTVERTHIRDVLLPQYERDF